MIRRFIVVYGTLFCAACSTSGEDDLSDAKLPDEDLPKVNDVGSLGDAVGDAGLDEVIVTDDLAELDSACPPDGCAPPVDSEGCEPDGGSSCPDVSECEDGPCAPAVCDPATFEVTCEGDSHVRQCRADGSAIDVLSCGEAAVCVDGACIAQSCAPGETACASPGTTETCNALGTAFLAPVECGPPGRCEVGRCLTACEDAALLHGARGCRFVLPSGHLAIEGASDTALSLDGVALSPLPLNGTTAFPMPDPSGAHVLVASAPVLVSLSVDGAFGDSAQVLPPSGWGTDHVVLGWPNSGSGEASLIRVVGSTPGTQITIVATAALEVLSGGDAVIAALDGGTAYTVALPLSAQIDLRVVGVLDDATGTRIVASAPVGVFFEHPCASVPAGVGPCAPLIEQVPPLDRLAPVALAVPLPPRASPQPDVFRVVAADDHVLVTLTPAVLPPFTLERGAHASWVATEAVLVTATGRVALSHLTPGAKYVGHGLECGGNGIGGPALTWVPPLVAHAPDTLIRVEVSDVTLDLALDPTAVVTVDGQSPQAVPTPGGVGSWARLTLPPGTHTVVGSAGSWRGVLLEERCGGTRATPLAASMSGVPSSAVAAVLNDSDGDGTPDATDCAPLDPAAHPLGAEGCNGIDDDCDTAVDEDGAMGCLVWFADGDGDGSGSQSLGACACEPPTAAATPFGGDCDDKDPYLGPLLLEVCNAIDDDCDSLVDEGCDDDQDGFCAEGAVIVTTDGVCAKGLGDCVDSSPTVNPAAFELFTNLLDDDCDGLTDAVSTTLPISDCAGLLCTGPTHAAVVCALDLCYGPDVVTGLELLAPNGGNPKTMIVAAEQLGLASNGLGPRAGSSSLALSTGTVGAATTNVVAGQTSTVDPLPSFPFKAFDVAELRLKLIVPDAATGFSIDTLFMSSELPEDAGKPDADRLYVLVKGSVSTSDAEVPIDVGACSSDLAIAETQGSLGEPACFIGVNSAFVEACSGGPEPATSLAGTPYACGSGGASTGWLRLVQPVTGGETLTLTIRLVDVGDALNDSQALVDNVQWLTGDVAPLLEAL